MKERLRSEEMRSRELGMSSESQVVELEKTIREDQAERRKMHNLIQELRGNVRVFARIRPFLPGDGCDDDTPPMCVPKSETALKLVSTGCLLDRFDFVFRFRNAHPSLLLMATDN